MQRHSLALQETNAGRKRSFDICEGKSQHFSIFAKLKGASVQIYMDTYYVCSRKAATVLFNFISVDFLTT